MKSLTFMQPITNSEDIPLRRLSVRYEAALHEVKDDTAIHYIKARLARELADKILNAEPFFYSTISESGGFRHITFGADCIILTTEEYHKIKNEIFRDGMRYNARHHEMGIL